MSQATSNTGVTATLAAYMAEARDRALPADVDREAKHRLLDSLAAVISGSTLLPGEMAVKYVRPLGGTPEAMVMTTDIVTSAANAALANGMMGHADETDDFDPSSKAHPGCSVVPAAWAMAEREGASGTAMLRAVALGYDVACRMLLAVDADKLRAAHHSAEGFGATFGATGAAASLARLDAMQMRYVLSYAAQQASGIWAWVGDEEHVEKAFDFAGMGARNGVTAATMVQMGFSGVPNVLDGEHNLLQAFSQDPDPGQLTDALGERFSVTATAIKPYAVGYPIQSALDALFTLTSAHNITGADVERVVAKLPTDGAGVVNNRTMPDINIQHCIALALVDGGVSFASTHSYERMGDPAVLAMKERVTLQAEPSLVMPEAPRQAIIEVTTRDGRVVSHHTKYAPGTAQNPLDTDGVCAKARDLIAPVLGEEATERLIDAVLHIEDVANVRDLRPLLARS